MLASTTRRSKPLTEPIASDLPTSTSHRLIIGDARRITPKDIGPVELVVTSPPYWSILDYGHEGQIGFGQSLQEYVSSMEDVWKTCYESLREGCRLVVNIGDQYLRAKRGTPYQIVPLHAIIVNSIRHLLGCRFLYLGSIIWRKVTTTHTTGGASVMGSYPYPRAVYPCFENEFIAIFRKDGTAPTPSHAAREAARMSIEEWRDLTQGVWSFPGTRQQENPASFPEALPRRIIRMFSFPGETVLDPFVGAGTTMGAAASLGRNSIGVELGFRTTSGRPFEDVVRERVLNSEPVAPYAGRPTFRFDRADREPASPHPSHA